MSNEKYVAPEMDIIEFGNEDLVCTISNTNVGKYDGTNPDLGIGGDIDTWTEGGEF